MKRISMDFGTAVVHRTVEDDGSEGAELIQADDRIAVSRDLLDHHDERWMRVHGKHLVLCNTEFYVETGEVTPYGDVIYRRVLNEGDL